MKVIRASVLGYCMGVKRAVESAEQALLHAGAGTTVYTLGPLIHNPSVLNSLAERGLRILKVEESSSLCKDDVVVIRAHGTTPQIEKTLEKSGACVVDATCPRVHGSQKRAALWSSRGYTVIIAGDKNHGEVTSIAGYAEGNCIVVQSVKEAEAVILPQKAVLLAQTTFSPVEFEKISSLLKKKNPSIEVFNTICNATLDRQNALLSLEPTDGILVIGGKNSANTRRLYETACTLCGHVALIESESEIPDEFFALGTVALTAGASTPDSIIDAVERTLLQGK